MPLDGRRLPGFPFQLPMKTPRGRRGLGKWRVPCPPKGPFPITGKKEAIRTYRFCTLFATPQKPQVLAGNDLIQSKTGLDIRLLRLVNFYGPYLGLKVALFILRYGGALKTFKLGIFSSSILGETNCKLAWV